MVAANQQSDDTNFYDTIIIGFGLSTIPLIRELQASHAKFKVFSSGKSIWDRFAENNRLNFDLVSSYHSSVYSFEQLNHPPSARYLTASEFHEFIASYKSQYNQQVEDEWIELIENHDEYSIVHTRSGKHYKCRNLVVATAFKRLMNKNLTENDYESLSEKTVVVKASGDSANLVIAKLLANKNKVIIVSSGFFCLDKLIHINGVNYALEDIEYHNITKLSPTCYKYTFSGGQLPAVKFPTLGRYMLGNNFFVKHKDCLRNFEVSPVLDIDRYPLFGETIVANGLVIVKYMPIDTYMKLYDNDGLEEAIEKGYLLNDLPFLIDNNYVSFYEKNSTIIESEFKTITHKGVTEHYDYIVESDHEVPAIPEIHICHANTIKSQYCYDVRDNYMGVVPNSLNRVYFLGFTRPMSGGLANIIEMQSLFIHQMITDTAYSNKIKKELRQRTDEYNARMYISTQKTPLDHLVFYGFYNEELGQIMGIAPKVTDCRTLRELFIYYLFPNMAIKYRQTGRYKIEGAKDFVKAMYKERGNYRVLSGMLLNYLLFTVLVVATTALYYHQQYFYFPFLAAVAVIFMILFSPLTTFFNANSTTVNRYINSILLIGLVTMLFMGKPIVGVLTLLGSSALIFIMRKLGWSRYFYNDMRHKTGKKYIAFYEKYCKYYQKIHHKSSSQED